MRFDTECTLIRNTVEYALRVTGTYTDRVPATFWDPPEGGEFEVEEWEVVAVNGNCEEAVCEHGADILTVSPITDAEWITIEEQVINSLTEEYDPYEEPYYEPDYDAEVRW